MLCQAVDHGWKWFCINDRPGKLTRNGALEGKVFGGRGETSVDPKAIAAYRQAKL